MGLALYSEHPTLPKWLDDGYPITICTDDFGVFATTLSKEYLHVATAFGLTRGRVVGLAKASAGYSFSLPGDKQAAQALTEVRDGCDALM